MADMIQVAIRKVPVLPFRVHLDCSCGGEFVFDDTPLALHPRTYKHTCNKCGAKVELQEAFPKTVYEEIAHEATGED